MRPGTKLRIALAALAAAATLAAAGPAAAAATLAAAARPPRHRDTGGTVSSNLDRWG